MIRNYLKIWGDFSEKEIVPSEDVLPPGRDLAELICTKLHCNGFQISVEVSQHDSYGWYFEVSLESSTVWCMLQLSDEWLMIFNQNGPMLKRMFGRLNKDEMALVLTQVNTYVSVSERIVKHGWFTEEEMYSDFAGATHPITAA